jgi:hypothetical protein
MKKDYLVHVQMLDKKICKTQEIKKNPSLIFDIFRDGKVSFNMKNNNLYCSSDFHKRFFTLNYFEYFEIK